MAGVVGPRYDADTRNFLIAAGITDATQKSAINTLVVDLKTANIWTKAIAIYPFVGQSASTVKWNLKNPLDTDEAFRLTLIGGLTYTNGLLSNGTNGYANTHVTPSTNLTNNNTHILWDCSSNVYGSYAESGLFTATGRFAMYNYINGLTLEMYSNGNIASIQTDTTGVICGSRVSSNDLKLFRNGAQLGSTFTGSGGNISNCNIKMYFGCLNNQGTAQFFTPRNYRFHSIGSGLTPSEVSSYTTIINTFNTTLKRNV